MPPTIVIEDDECYLLGRQIPKLIFTVSSCLKQLPSLHCANKITRVSVDLWLIDFIITNTIIVIITIIIINMPVVAALLRKKSSTVTSFAAPAEPSRCLMTMTMMAMVMMTTFLITHVVEVSSPAMGSTCTGSSADRWHSRCPPRRPGTSRCSSGEAEGKWTGRRRLGRWGGGRVEGRVGVCDWPSSSDSPSGHLQDLVATHWSW